MQNCEEVLVNVKLALFRIQFFHCCRIHKMIHLVRFKLASMENTKVRLNDTAPPAGELWLLVVDWLQLLLSSCRVIKWSHFSQLLDRLYFFICLYSKRKTQKRSTVYSRF